MRLQDRESYKHLRSLADDGDEQAQLVLRGIASCSGPGKYATPQYTAPTIHEIRERGSADYERQRLRAELSRRLLMWPDEEFRA